MREESVVEQRHSSAVEARRRDAQLFQRGANVEVIAHS
jgi:hypothetical protein